MQIDARPFRAGYSQAFLSRKGSDSFTTKQQIARAYFVGCSPKKLAEEHGISVQKVLAIAKWYDLERMRARNLAQAVESKPEPEPEPVLEAIQAEPEARTYTVMKRHTYTSGSGMEIAVTLPLFSIQRRVA